MDTLDRHTFIIDQLRKSSNVATSIQRKISTKVCFFSFRSLERN